LGSRMCASASASASSLFLAAASLAALSAASPAAMRAWMSSAESPRAAIAAFVFSICASDAASDSALYGFSIGCTPHLKNLALMADTKAERALL